MIKFLLAAISVLAIGYTLQVGATDQSNKYYGDCTGSETAGRCAEKCPEGSYLVGYKSKDAGYICKLVPTGCPYGDSIPMDNCNKFKPAEPKPVKEEPAFRGK
jgi:hypothetical protein